MRYSFQKELFAKYPKLFEKNNVGDVDIVIECGNGWLWLIDLACSTIQNYTDNYSEYIDKTDTWYKPTQPKIRYIKEKFGGLRIIVDDGDKFTYGIIKLIENLSYKICEECGTNVKVKIREKSFIKTICGKCYYIWRKRI